ncbi:MAG TPA: Rrf2 family transcriptional regulator [Candidatus Nitrosotalea sp.]|nr:Rrf2 family transcriptional regulator [Candidatus Nitrosotalea sp.]
MELTLSRRGDYAVRAAIALARVGAGGGYVKTREISLEMGIPAAYTPQILGLLAHAGLAEARAGRRGGYRLTRDPSEIRLVDVVQAAEGSLRPDRCSLRGGPCRWNRMCALHPAWSAATNAFCDLLGNVTLASVTAVDVALAQGSYPVGADSHRN